MTKDEDFERDAAETLGRMVMMYSQLDMQLALCLAWLGRGTDFEAQAREAESATLHSKLQMLNGWLETHPPTAEACSAYRSWVSDAHTLREIRNQWTHGRWAVLTRDRVLVNIVGLPTSANQVEHRYGLHEVRENVEQLRQLIARLQDLRHEFPL